MSVNSSIKSDKKTYWTVRERTVWRTACSFDLRANFLAVLRAVAADGGRSEWVWVFPRRARRFPRLQLTELTMRMRELNATVSIGRMRWLGRQEVRTQVVCKNIRKRHFCGFLIKTLTTRLSTTKPFYSFCSHLQILEKSNVGISFCL